MQIIFLRRAGVLAAAGVLLGTTALVGCGGGGDASSQAGTATANGSSSGSSTELAQGSSVAAATAAALTTRSDAHRLLTQATFGPTEADIATVMAQGPAAWVDAQLALPSSSAYLARWDSDNAAIQKITPTGNAGANPVTSQFYAQALTSRDQLRQRVGFALSEIFVVSLNQLGGDYARMVASYADLLNKDAFANYRTLLQDVSLHPAMGVYLSMLHNQKEDVVSGRIPDQNYAREVMQLFSIGLVQLNTDGSKKLAANGSAIETYTSDDISGLSKALTGWSWAGPDTTSSRFWGGTKDANRMSTPMQAYPAYHSTSEKRFLGTVVAAQTSPAPATSLAAALDTLYQHPNVGPFIGRQLIQRLVTSHPSPAYVGRVAAVFNNNGSGVRGDMKAVVRAVLLDTEARQPSAAGGAAGVNGYGKVKEPVLRLTAWMRAFGAVSDSGKAWMGNTDDPGLALGQTPFRSPTVFNFWRPGYQQAGSETGAAGLTMPELQITNESSVAGYVNYMMSVLPNGAGLKGSDGTAARRDIQPDYSGELAVAATPSTLVDRVAAKLLPDGGSASLKAEISTAVTSIAVPVLKADKSNQASVDNALRNRVLTSVLLTLATPEFIVQK